MINNNNRFLTPFPAFPQGGRSQKGGHHFPLGGNKKGGISILNVKK